MLSERRQRIVYAATDLVTAALAWLVFNVIRYGDVVQDVQPYDSFAQFVRTPNVILGQIFFPLMMVVLFWLSGYYGTAFFKSRTEELVSTLTSAIGGSIIIFFAAIINDPIPDRAANYELLLMLMGLMFGFVYLGRVVVTGYTNSLIRRHNLRFNALIIGTSQNAEALRGRIEKMPPTIPNAYNIVGYVEPDEQRPLRQMDLPVYRLSEVKAVIEREGVKALLVTPHRGGMQRTLDLVNHLFPLDIPILISPTLHQLITSKPKIVRFTGEPLIDITHATMSESTRILKRCIDVASSLIALLLLSPLFGAIAIAIKRDSPGPVFYRQERVGLRKKPFKIIKFRSMAEDAEADGPQLSSATDPRITRVGHFLRKYRLDELPQFINVLRGEMTLVGPRPERAYYVEQIMKKAPYYTLVHQLTPGITSLGMVKHGYAATVDEMIDRLQYDLMYLENVTLVSDLKILIYTIHTVITGKGV